MSYLSRRVRTIQVLLHGSSISSHSSYRDIRAEYSQVVNVASVKKRNRRLLLQILHSTRGLDSALRALIRTNGGTIRRNSLGSYLHELVRMGKIHQSERQRFQNIIVYARNRYMHEAGAYPNNSNEIHRILVEMDMCISRSI